MIGYVFQMTNVNTFLIQNIDYTGFVKILNCWITISHNCVFYEPWRLCKNLEENKKEKNRKTVALKLWKWGTDENHQQWKPDWWGGI